MPDQERQKVKVFISYAHDDEDYFKVFIHRLEKVLKSSPDFDYQIWDDRDILVGSDWNDSIQNNLAKADLAILLVSDSFLASDYIEGKEFGHLIEKHPSTLIIPVLFAPCEFSQWGTLAKKQFFVAKGSDFKQPRVTDFTFADLVEFDRDRQVLPNPNIRRYVQKLSKAIKKSYEAHLKKKGKSVESFTPLDPIKKAITEINTYLRIGGLPAEMEKDFKEWKIDLLERNMAKISEIATKFADAKAILEKTPSTKDKKGDFTIWLNRVEQRTKCAETILSFKGNTEPQSPLIFGIMGCFENDNLTDVSKMLQKHYFNTFFKKEEEGYILPKRSNDSLILRSSENAKYQYQTILAMVLERTLGDIPYEELPELLEKEYGKHHIIIQCGIRDWNQKGLSAFFKLWNDTIKRNSNLPFLLLLEFDIEEPSKDKYSELEKIFKSEGENNRLVLLPKLGEVSKRDIREFYAIKIEGNDQCYRDVFISDQDSLRTEDAPLCYNDAVAKLRLK